MSCSRLVVALLLLGCGCSERRGQVQDVVTTEDKLIMDKEIVEKAKSEQMLKIAERELVSKYGEKVLKERPWIILEKENEYVIEGNPASLRGRKGGVARIVLDREFKVRGITHGK